MENHGHQGMLSECPGGHVGRWARAAVTRKKGLELCSEVGENFSLWEWKRETIPGGEMPR